MAFQYNHIFKIPERCILEKRLTKVFFLKNFALSAKEKKIVNSNISAMTWLASIKPLTANIPDVKQLDYKYEEVQLIVCSINDSEFDNKAIPCLEMIQKYIPYQLIVIVEDSTQFIINASDKRINKTEPSRRTIVRHFNTPSLSKLYKNELTESFYNALDFSNLDKTNLELLYKSYIQAVVQYQAASITGNYQKRSNARTAQDMEHLEQIEQLERDIVSLSSQIKKESQLNEKVQLNIKIQKKRQKIQSLKNTLTEA